MAEESVAIDWTAEISKARVEAQEAVGARRNRGAARPPRSESTASVAPAPSALLTELDRTFSPENMEGLVALPAELMLATTGHAHWLIEEKELKKLSTTGATAARYFLTVDPKWVVLAMFLTNVTVVYGSRFLKDLAIYRKEREEKEGGQQTKS